MQPQAQQQPQPKQQAQQPPRQTAMVSQALLNQLVYEDDTAVFVNYGSLPECFRRGVPYDLVVNEVIRRVTTHLTARKRTQFTIRLVANRKITMREFTTCMRIFILKLAQAFKLHWPSALHECHIENAPYVLTAIHDILKMCVRRDMLRKIHVHVPNKRRAEGSVASS